MAWLSMLVRYEDIEFRPAAAQKNYLHIASAAEISKAILDSLWKDHNVSVMTSTTRIYNTSVISCTAVKLRGQIMKGDCKAHSIKAARGKFCL